MHSIYKSIAFIFLLCITLGLPAQNPNTQKSNSKTNTNNNESVLIKFKVATKDQINNDLTHILSIDNVKTLGKGQGYEVTAYANPKQFKQFLTRHIAYQKINTDQAKTITMATTIAQMANWDRYPTYSVYEQMMANFAATYPGLCDIDTILSPTPSGNYRILVAKISDNVHTNENEPRVLLTSSIHGDETTGYILMLRLINYLLTNYGVLPKVTNLVNNVEIWINPMSNPEGTYYSSSPAGSTVATSRRGNFSNVDMNRNYPDPRAGQHPDGNSWAPETQAFMNFADLNHFNMSVNFHGGAEVVNYPWDTWLTTGNQNADRLWWEKVCTSYVDTARVTNSSYMTVVVSDGVTEGGDWYIITGGRQDYMNYYKHCREVTIELDATKTTPVENLNTKWNQNFHSLLNYIQESTYGVHGIITDSCNGLPIRAKVWVNSYDQVDDSSQVYSSLPLGNYYKYMIAGTYSFTFSAPGYTSKTVTGVTVTNGAATLLNVQLTPAASPSTHFTGVQNDICSGTVQFTNTSTASTSYMWYFGDGTSSSLVNPSHTYTSNGVYTVMLKAFNCKGADSLIQSNYITINLPVISSVTNGSVCQPASVTLSASGNGTIKWYDAISGGNLLGTGSSWTSPSISTTTTYYAGAGISIPKTAAIGTATSSTSQTALTPFSSYYEGSREQYLVRASELTAAGLSAGNITSLAFNVTAAGSYAQKNFTIKMAHTANTVITGAYGVPAGSFTTVYTNASETTPAVGLKSYTFSSPFVWDGTSNILIDICHDNDVSNSCSSCYGTNSTVTYTATGFNSCFGSYADNVQSCGVQAASVLTSAYYTSRPNMIFGYQGYCVSSRHAVIAYVNPSGKMFNGKLFLESLYSGNNLMNQARDISATEFGSGIADQITVELHNNNAPYSVAYTYTPVNLNTDGTFLIPSIPCDITGSYYLVIKHRNSIETWSSTALNFGNPSSLTYDFTVSAGQVYGNNEKTINGIYAIWGGDASRDGIVDGSDMAMVDNNSRPPILMGYHPEDINGDGMVDGSDMAIIDNNSKPPLVQVIRPGQ